MYRAQELGHARHLSVHYHQEQEKYARPYGIEEIQSHPEAYDNS